MVYICDETKNRYIMKKIGVLLHGCGVFDGTEIQEAVLSLLAIKEAGAAYVCFAPNVNQHHVLNHITGEEMNETRNVLIESARIARGNILDIKDLNLAEIDALVLPGGFGTAKNITKWAFEGPNGEINAEVAQLLVAAVQQQKPIVGLCMSPTTIAKALAQAGIKAHLSVGTSTEASPYDIAAIAGGVASLGHTHEAHSIREIAIDNEHKIISAPCYMMEGDIVAVNQNIKQAIAALMAIL